MELDCGKIGGGLEYEAEMRLNWGRTGSGLGLKRDFSPDLHPEVPPHPEVPTPLTLTILRPSAGSPRGVPIMRIS